VKGIADMANFIYIRQKGGYGNATPVKNAQHIIGNEPFAVLWGDEFIYSDIKPRLKQCIEVFEEFGDPVISGVRIEKKEDLSRYGIADLEPVRGRISKIKKIIEKPDPDKAPSNIATHGCYILTPDIFDVLNSQKPGTGGEYYLPEAIDELRARGRSIYACEIEGGRYYDTGNKMEYMKTIIEFAVKHPEIGEEFTRYLKGVVRGL
jgi:UTP--glucose-1-phosphate uridylyltransferase